MYKNRLKFYGSFEWTAIPELKNTKNISIAEQKEKESELLLKALDANDEVILLDEKGQEFSSKEFSLLLEKKRHSGLKNIVFIVGGSYGFSDKVYKRAGALISLSKMTFSHQMVRVFFIEQLYRAMTISKGEPYHHE
jgi:23S rRNA (pseudouridine1915-N3)-methyltransferase